MTITAHHPRTAFRAVLVCLCLAGLLASVATDAGAQARRRRPLFGAPSTSAAAVARDRASVDRPRARRERLVTLAASALDPRTARDGASDLDLRLFADRRLAARLDRIERRSATSFTWHGRVIGANGGPVTFVSTNGVVAGTVFTSDAVFEIGYAGGGLHEVRELDPLAFPSDDPAEDLPVVDSADETTPPAPTDTAAEIDVLVVWTPAARTAAGGSDAIQSTIDLAIANANTAYANSGITTRLRLVNKAEVTYTESSISTDLGRLAGTSDGYLETVHTLRDQYGADLVSLIGNGYTASNACGIGYLMTSPSASFATNAFNVVDWSCAAGNLSLAHELGHNQGMHHDVANAGGGQGAYPYSYGYQDPAGNFRTVMAYACGYGAGCPRRPYFSTPSYTYGGVPVGTASADNAQTLNNTAAYVANFRQAVIGACTYALSPSTVNAATGGGTQAVTVTAGTGCTWSAQSSAAWLTFSGSTSGSGNGSLTLSFTANTTTSLRTATVTAGGQTVTVSQAGQSTGTAVTVTAPSGTVGVSAADDFAVNVLQDRWDMNQKWDLGWFVHAVDQPAANLSNPVFANGLFTATASTADPSVFLLETGNPVAAATGRTGSVYAIDAEKYRRLNFRLCLTGAANQTVASVGQLYWSRDTIYSDLSTPNSFYVYGGCSIYSVDLRTYSVGRMPSVPGLNQFEWTGVMRALRLDPTNAAGQGVTIDWASLTAVSDATTTRTITWSGTAAVDIFLDNNNNSADGNLGLLWNDGTAALGITGGSYSFQLGALPPGDYYVALRDTGTGAVSYSPGYYRVSGKPTVTVISPSDEGSSDDFATVQLGNAWDMQQAADVERTANVTSPALATINLETTAGTTLPSQTVYRGTATAGPGDPITWMLWSGGRGRNYRIDTSRYRILTLEMGIAGARDVNLGSIARLVWKRSDETLENVSEDIIVNHRQGVSSLDRIVLDMADRTVLPLEPGAGSPSRSGWTGLVDNFRVDPHEFADARQFWVRRVKLAALERAYGSYTVRWRLDGVTDPTTRVAIYADTDNAGFNGTLVAQNLQYDNAGDGTGSYVWNLSGVAAGTYFLHVRATTSGGTVLNQQYARWPITVSATPISTPVLRLDRTILRYAATRNGAQKTGSQDVGVTFTGGATTWTATALAPCDFVQIAGATGTGRGVFSVSMADRTNYPAGATLNCTVRVDAPGATNSPQFVDVTFTIYQNGTTRAPFGYIDTPADNVTVSGAFGVTGWALDDLQVSAITIWRDPLPGEPTHSNGKVFIGNAVTLEGARPDVEALNPTMPLNYKAGWGALVLSNQLPGGGNGPFRFYVYVSDPEGNQILLGSRRVVCANASAVKPFGTIDTPGNGDTVSGTVYNFGWALTAQPNYIPTDGSTIWVFIDDVPVGHPVYNQYRPDIASAFPGYANTNGAVGYYALDTTLLSNGLHTIAWSVTDSAGNLEGIGSRFFRVRN